MPKFNKILKGKINRKKIFKIVTLVFLLVAVVAGIVLVKQNQDIREDAAVGSLCKSEGGKCVPSDYDCQSTLPSNGDDCGSGKKCGFGNCVAPLPSTKNCLDDPKQYCSPERCNLNGDVSGKGICSGVPKKFCCTTKKGGSDDDSTPTGGGNGNPGTESGGGGSGSIISMGAIDIKGSVTVENSDGTGINRFVGGICRNTSFKYDSKISVYTKYIGTIKSSWNCTDGEFEFKQSKAPVGSYRITLTPPTGYKCSSVIVKSGSATNRTSGCSTNITVAKTNSPFFISYQVVEN